MIIILEGTEGAGKTTLANKIVETTRNARREHFKKPESRNAERNYWRTYAAAITAVKPDETVVFDRSWISDMVYGPIMRGHDTMSMEMCELLCSRVIANGGGLLIYCTAPVDVLWQRCEERGEDYVTNSYTLSRLHQAYEELYPKLNILPKVKYITG